MKFGVAMFVTEHSIPPHELAIALEERGLESLWAPEHSHIPIPRVTPWGGGGDLPDQYYAVLDPFVVLSAAATVTKKLKLGTGICLVVQRDPIQNAKEVASLDQISGGRFLFGVGVGWLKEEIANHGTVFETRAKLTRERIEAMKAIWTEEEASYSGEFVNFTNMIARPKPVQNPHPPIIVGGGFPHAARRAIRYGDGWIPLGGRMDLFDVLPKFRQMALDAGRNPDDLPISNFGVPVAPEAIAKNADAGVDRVVFSLPSEGTESTLRQLDRIADVSAKF